MNRFRVLVALALAGVAAPVVRAQDDHPDPAKVLAPYITETTVAAGVADVKNLDIDAAAAWVERIAGKHQAGQFRQGVGKGRDAFVRAGGRYVYFTVDLGAGHPAENALFVIPVAAGGNPQDVVAFLKEAPDLNTAVKGNVVLAGTAASLARDRRPKQDPAFARGLAALDTFPNRVVVVPPAVFRRAQEELSPNLPAELGGGSIKVLTDGIVWAGVGADLSAAARARVVVQAKDADAAKELDRLAGRGIDLLKRVAAAGRFPDFDALARVLRPKIEQDRLVVTADLKKLEPALAPILAKVRAAASRQVTMNHLRQIGLAMHNYHDVTKAFPPQYTVDKKKRPLLSWRVHILPYIEQPELYREFKLDEPWDSPHNKKLIARMPEVYRSPLAKKELGAEGKTTYVVPTGPELIFNGPRRMKLSKIVDGTTNTILAVDATDARAVYWTQPEDYKVDRKDPKKGLVHADGPGIILALFADGSVRVIADAVTDETMWLLFDPADGNPIPDMK
jgi:hypothetical protein